MSSTNKTANLQLNQWELTDPFNMADFNADNAKIDAAMGKNQFQKLMEVTLQTAVSTVELDLSSIDLSQYLEITVYMADAGTNAMYMRLNNISGNVYQYRNYMGGWQTYGGYMYGEYGNRMTVMLNGVRRYVLNPGQDYYYDGLTIDNLHSLTMLYDPSTPAAMFQVGTEFFIMGVRK